MGKGTGARRAPRKPHNAKTAEYATFNELLGMIADQPRKATIAGREVTMTRAEALLRVMVERAMQGKVREIKQVLQMMARDPGLAANSRLQTHIFINGSLANV
jgi:hypothetical protein